ncbi:MAG TPA: hypothetical protein VKZ49_00060, partial [Polyangiaceae bacterium]|nr:hypothetical protein [Polyangiaceae bacterium]
MTPRRPFRSAVGAAIFFTAAAGAFSCSAEAPEANNDGTLTAGTGGDSSGSGGVQTGSGGAQPGSGGVSNTGGTPSGSGGSNTGGTPSGTGGSNTGGTPSGTGGDNTGGTPSGTGGGGNEDCTDFPPPGNDSCANAQEWGWCEADWLNGACARSCGHCSGGSGGSSGSGGSGGNGGSVGNAERPPPITNGGINGWLSRYWDCCKPACGWSDNAGGTPIKSCNKQNQPHGGNGNTSSCNGGDAYMCWDAVPWAAGENVSYGFVAASGGNYHCGRCYQIDFKGSADSGDAGALVNKSMIVQVVNNGGVGADQL